MEKPLFPTNMGINGFTLGGYGDFRDHFVCAENPVWNFHLVIPWGSWKDWGANLKEPLAGKCGVN